MLNVILIGYGHLGKWHAEKINSLDNASLVGIVERDKNQQDLAKAQYPNVSIVSSISDSPEFDTAIIVTPTSTHFAIAKELISLDKNIFCEKPMCSTIAQAKELKELYEKSDKKFQVGHSERFHEVWDTKKEVIAKHVETSEFSLKINRYAPFKGRATDVDVVQDLMIHDIDLMLYLTKLKPISVNAFGSKSLTDKWDYVEAFFQFENGSVATLVVGRNSTKEVRELEFNSPKGSLLIDLFTCKIFETSKNEIDGKFVRESFYIKRDHLLEEHKCFYDSIHNNKSTVVTFEDGYNAVELVEKVLTSIENKKVEFFK